MTGEPQQPVELGLVERGAAPRSPEPRRSARRRSSRRSCPPRPSSPRRSRDRPPGVPATTPTLVAATRSRQRVGQEPAALAELLDGIGERHVAAGDRGRPRAAVGLDDVAVDGDRALAELGQLDHRAQRAADEPLDLVGAAAASGPPRGRSGSTWRGAACRTRRSPSPARCRAGTGARDPRPRRCRSRACRRPRPARRPRRAACSGA